MGYTSYEFYKNKYFGSAIDEDDFQQWNEKASRQLDVFTFRRLRDAFPEDAYTKEQIELCVCELAEKMMEMDKYLKASTIQTGTAGMVSGMVKSVSAGSESITYATGETVYANALKDGNVNEFYQEIAVKYLEGLSDANGIHLLYAGW